MGLIDDLFDKTVVDILPLKHISSKFCITKESIFYTLKTTNDFDIFIECFFTNITVFSIYKQKQLLSRDSGSFSKMISEIKTFINTTKPH